MDDKALSIFSVTFLPLLLLIDFIFNNILNVKLQMTSDVYKYSIIIAIIVTTIIKYDSNINRVTILSFGSSNIEIYFINVLERMKFLILIFTSLVIPILFNKIEIEDFNLILIISFSIIIISSLNSIGISIKTSMSKSTKFKLIKRYLMVFSPIVSFIIVAIWSSDVIWSSLFGYSPVNSKVSIYLSLSLICFAIYFIEYKFFTLYKNYIDLEKYNNMNKESKITI